MILPNRVKNFLKMERPLQNLGKVSPLGMRETVDCMNHFTFGSTVSANKNMNQIQEQFWLYLRSSLHGSVLSIWDALFPANWSFGNDSGQSIQISYTLITAIFRRLFFSQLKFIFKKKNPLKKLGPVWLGFFWGEGGRKTINFHKQTTMQNL